MKTSSDCDCPLCEKARKKVSDFAVFFAALAISGAAFYLISLWK